MASIASGDPIAPTALPADRQEALAALDSIRRRTFALIAHLSDGDLCRQHSPIMSPLVWDLAHIAAYEDLWLCHRHGGLDLLRPELAEVYDAFETPRSLRGEIDLLGAEDARAYMSDVRAHTARALAETGLGDATIYELVLRHELQHTETMRQTLALAGLLPAGEPTLAALDDGDDGCWIEVPAGPFQMGAAADGFAYDNERPRHTVDVPGFQIARRPVTNASWMRFSEGGGYERREWWSEEGWAWKQEHDIAHDERVAAADPAAPACHVSWFEAAAFATASGGRLPSEAEWEKAAGAGALAGVGGVWEWTSGVFAGYPGFQAHPYREYSEVFFDNGYRVLRGGSWATDQRVKTPTFRNWDLPIRRQIFAGVRLARDAS